MKHKELGEITTFYSYKGGTGRSMALANVACILAKSQEGRVLIIDWDLEAPGIHRFFKKRIKSIRGNRALDEKLGLIDLCCDLRDILQNYKNTNNNINYEDIEKAFEELDLNKYILETDIPSLYLIKAGKSDINYATKVNSFNWVKFYEDFPEIFKYFALYLSKRYKHILIDSRTGITDISGITTMLMPDRLVTVFTPNRQSIKGVIDLIEEALSYRTQSNDLRPLIVFPLPSRIEASEPDLREKWRYGDPNQDILGYQTEFESLFKKSYDLADCNLEDYFNEVQIQHVPRYSYGEDIAALVEESNDRLSLTASYKNFVNKILDLRAPWINPKHLAFGDDYHQEGKVKWEQGNYIEARKLFEKSLQEFKNIGNINRNIAVLRDLGKLTTEQKNYVESLKFFEQALEIGQRQNDFTKIAMISNDLGEIAALQGNYERARNLFNDSLAIGQNLKNDDIIARSINNLSNVGLIPHQIPPSPYDFKDRKKEISDILADLDKGSTIIGIRGMAGVGKTALALAVANRILDRFPDGHLFLNLRGTNKNPMSPIEAMRQIIRAYRPTYNALNDLTEVKGNYLSVLSGKKALLLLDDAAGRDQIEPLLPPGKCAVLITSRNRFTLPGLVEHDLDVLPPFEASEFLLQISGRIGNQADRLAELCGYLPLALRNAASALAERKDINVADYEHRLSDNKARLELVEASFSLSYDLMSSIRRKHWCRLTVFPGDFDLDGGTAVLKMTRDASAEALSDLVKWSLLDFTSSGDARYRMHDLSRLFAESRLELAEREDAKQRHAKHYLKVLSNAEKLYNFGGKNLLDGLMLFDREWANIKEGQTWVEVLMENLSKSKVKLYRKVILQMANSYPYNGVNVLNLRQHPRERIRWLNTALAASKMMEKPNFEISHLNNLGRAYVHLGEVRKAIEYYEQALAISREIEDKKSEGFILNNLGSAYFHLGEAQKAIEYHEQALAISREIEDKRSEVVNLGSLGNIFDNLGKVQKALEYHEQALAISREIGDKRSEGADLGNLGIVYSHLGKLQKAIEHYEQALAINRQIENREGEGANLGNLGNAYLDVSDVRKAIEYYEQALIISREIEDKRSEGAALGSLGNAYANMSNVRKAIEYHELALAISREIENREGEGAALGNLGNDYLDLGALRKVIEYYEQALAISRKIENRRSEGISLNNLGIAYFYLGEAQKALEYHEQALTISREIEDKRSEGAALGNLGIVCGYMGEPRQAIKYYNQALCIVREIEDRQGEGVYLGNLGNVYCDMGDVRNAIEYHEQALAISREIGNRRSEGINLNNLGEAYFHLGEAQKAIEYYDQALAISREIENKRSEGAALGNLGEAYFHLGELQKALEYHEQALAISRQILDLYNEGENLSNIGKVNAALGDINKAVGCYEESLNIARRIKYRKMESNVLYNLGKIYTNLNETLKAIEYYTQSLMISRGIEYRRGEGEVLYNMSLALEQLGKHADAIDHAKAALRIFEQIESPDNERVRKKLLDLGG